MEEEPHHRQWGMTLGHDTAGENDLIAMDDFIQDVVDGDGNNNEDLGEPVLEDPEYTELFEEFINRLDNADLLFGSPRWLENELPRDDGAAVKGSTR